MLLTLAFGSHLINAHKFLPLIVFSKLLLATSAASAAINLVPNGDFEAGNTGFGSFYEFRNFPTEPAKINNAENQYAVLTSPFPWNPLFINTGDHTTGTGLMFVGNGSSDTAFPVWFRDGIAVDSNTVYFFEAFVMNVVNAVLYPPGGNPNTFSILSFYANGTLLGTRTTDQLGVWQGLSTQWNSGLATTVDLKILNSNPIAAGNDFAIDDIFLGQQSTVNAVPEPTSLAIWGIGALGCVIAGYRRRMAT